MPRMALVVDDSMLIRYSVCRYFEERGFLVEAATNGQEALEMLEHVTPNIIVTDLQMPRMTGSQLITILKGRPDTANVPIIVVAGKNSVPELNEEPRAKDVIFKDIDLREQLDRALESIFPAAGR
ncbi:MAG TPA: response regulator [Terriglobales bacterium]|nr:response regulator [Terriglobales bacterium]